MKTNANKGTTEAFLQALALTTGGKSVKQHGHAFRDGWTEVALGKTALTLQALKKAVRKALKASGCRSQQGLFCTRELNETRAIEFYIQGTDWYAVVLLGGTQKAAWLDVHFSG